VYFPPAFLHNLIGPAPFLLPIHLSPMSAAPQFPTAKSVTVARIASPHSVHRAFQTSFLDALKDYFKVKERVLKKGDLVAVGIESEGARFGEGRTDEEEYQ
jgi:peroxin-6